MTFKFESQEFKSTFEQVELIAKKIIETENNSNEIVNIAIHFLSAAQVLNINTDLSEFDKIIEYSRKQPVSNFVSEIGKALKVYKDTKQDSDLLYLFELSLNLINIYFSELTFILGGVNGSISIEVSSVSTFVSEKYLKHPKFGRYVKFAERELPFQIFKELFHSSKIKNLTELNSNLKQASELLEKWEKSFEIKKNTVFQLEQKLAETKLTYDFLGLNKGFQQLYEQKKDELKAAKNTYGFVATAMFTIPFAEFVALVAAFFYFDGKIPSNMWLVSIPFITLILITLYLLKISLQDKRAIQSQMMQLELRMALCQFIHNYAEDSETLHKKNSVGFEKFENIIFSPLVSSDDKIPTTFDGMEQLAKLIGEFRRN
ncbi:hypothetical protein [Acinetobacter variabilis]|uniref:Uncharacterized protein n=1 Tax=Acinetobacter variabilis TaxID=70346 RepID=N9MK05_9GAMM|nr:hypothetical protein [Acinetobacter variabilis]ENX08913.1 hypothetical protein F897_02065 [Acinetobacter variabilis]UBI31062.1 hypothetical protein LA331_02490 [Acinetobacter variabilis]BCT89260.1 hypothetical protein RYU24_16650 [Acinetobacter variabilis]